MTEQDDELRNLFQRKNLENAFPLDEQNWKKMFSVLKNERNGRRVFIYFSLIVLLLGLGSAWFFVEQAENVSKTPALVSQQSKNETQNAISGQQNSDPEGSVPISAKGNLEMPKPDGKKKEKHVVKKTEASLSKAQHTESVKEKLALVEQEPLIRIPGQAKIDIQLVRKNNTEGAGKVTAPFTSNSSIPEKKLAIVESSDQEPENKRSNPADKDVPETKDIHAKTEAPVASMELKAEESASAQDRPELSEPRNQAYKDTIPFIPVLVTDVLPDTVRTIALAKEKNVMPVEKKDSTLAIGVPPGDTLQSKTLPTHRIFLEAGTNYVFGWKTNNKTEASGFNPLIGLHYYHDVNRKIGLSIGLQYTTINHLSNTSHTSTTTRIKFGEEVDVTVISALNMHYLLLPLKLNYGFSRNDLVCIGYTVGYLLDVESRVEKYSTRLDYSSTPVVSHSKGYTAGFNPFDGQIAVGYRRRLFKEWYVYGEFFYGLRDIKNNVAYASNEFERTCGFRLSLGINLWKK